MGKHHLLVHISRICSCILAGGLENQNIFVSPKLCIQSYILFSPHIQLPSPSSHPSCLLTSVLKKWLEIFWICCDNNSKTTPIHMVMCQQPLLVLAQLIRVDGQKESFLGQPAYLLHNLWLPGLYLRSVASSSRIPQTHTNGGTAAHLLNSIMLLPHQLYSCSDRWGRWQWWWMAEKAGAALGLSGHLTFH